MSLYCAFCGDELEMTVVPPDTEPLCTDCWDELAEHEDAELVEPARIH